MTSIKTDAAPSEDAEASIITASRLKSDFTGEVIRINVSDGRDSISCQVHKQLLQQKSPYFAAPPNFREGIDNEVTLNDMSPDAFQNLVHWFYRDCLDPQAENAPTVLVETWIAADRLLMSKCRNTVMDQLRQYCRENVYLIAVLLEAVGALGIPPEVPLMQYLTDQLAFDCTAIYGDDTINASNWPSLNQGSIGFVLTIKIITMAQDMYTLSKRPTNPSMSPGCVYHDHIEGEECHLKQKI